MFFIYIFCYFTHKLKHTEKIAIYITYIDSLNTRAHTQTIMKKQTNN